MNKAVGKGSAKKTGAGRLHVALNDLLHFRNFFALYTLKQREVVNNQLNSQRNLQSIGILSQPGVIPVETKVALPLIAGYLRERESEGRMCDQFSDSHGSNCDNNTLRVGSIWERWKEGGRTKPEQSFIAGRAGKAKPYWFLAFSKTLAAKAL